MFNMVGEIIGIVSAIISKSGGSEGLGFAVTLIWRVGSFWNRDLWGGVAGCILMGKYAKILTFPRQGGNAHRVCSERLLGCAGWATRRHHEGNHRRRESRLGW